MNIPSVHFKTMTADTEINYLSVFCHIYSFYFLLNKYKYEENLKKQQEGQERLSARSTYLIRTTKGNSDALFCLSYLIFSVLKCFFILL